MSFLRNKNKQMYNSGLRADFEAIGKVQQIIRKVKRWKLKAIFLQKQKSLTFPHIELI
jgi:hypothetical protein